MRIAVISDTHFPARGLTLPDICVRRLKAADLILHAGDLATMDLLELLRAFGPPVAAVHGNVDDTDVRRALPAEIDLDLGGLRLAMLHDAGIPAGRSARLRQRFPAADVVVFGHSHIPVVDRAAGGLLLLNPGSPTDRRRQPHHTMAELEIEPGRPPRATIVVVDGPRAPNN
jgi:putative phosphoesterase